MDDFPLFLVCIGLVDINVRVGRGFAGLLEVRNIVDIAFLFVVLHRETRAGKDTLVKMDRREAGLMESKVCEAIGATRLSYHSLFSRSHGRPE